MKFKNVPIEEINAMNKGTMMEALGIECIEVGEDYVKSRMPVVDATKQPMGLLHGGASAALIESIGSMGSALVVDLSKEAPVGLEVNANHISSAKEGFVIATGKLVHAGRRTHLWQVDIHHEETGKLVCTGRLTIMIVPVV